MEYAVGPARPRPAIDIAGFPVVTTGARSERASRSGGFAGGEDPPVGAGGGKECVSRTRSGSNLGQMGDRYLHVVPLPEPSGVIPRILAMQ